MQQSATRRRLSLLLTALTLALTSAAFTTAGAALGGPEGTPAEDRAKGLVWSGIVRDDTGACPGAYRLVGVNDDVVRCTHGPDPAPDGVDVTQYRTTEQLVAATEDGSMSASSSTVPCYGDGTTGKRVQAVYAYASDVADRSATVVDLIAGWAGNVDRIFSDSAAETGGTRHVRWVTDASCRLSVIAVRMSPSGDDGYYDTVNQLKAAGLNRSDRKYLVWVDANRYCGLSDFRSDDRAGLSNANENGLSYARIDNGCWGRNSSVEAHELMHGLGGVQYSAPHSTGAGHCTEEYDRMCLKESTSTVLSFACPSSHERLFDCGHDDYFHTNPGAGSYLAKYWNAASSSFLEQAEPSTTPPTSQDPGPSGGSEPAANTESTTSTTTWSGSLSRKAASRTYEVTVGTGAIQATLSFSKAKSLTLSLIDASGTVVAETTGASSLSLSASASAGTYSLVVSTSSGNGSFSLTATYASP